MKRNDAEGESPRLRSQGIGPEGRAAVPAIFVQSSDPPSPALGDPLSTTRSLQLDLSRISQLPGSPGSAASPQLTPRSPLAGSPGDHSSVFWGAVSPGSPSGGISPGAAGDGGEGLGLWGGAFQEALEEDDRSS
jgi:hypothetical protein